MAGLLGIISHTRHAVAESELAGLIEAFIAVRGGQPQRQLEAGGWAYVAVVDIGPEATVASAGRSWFAAVGAVHADLDLLPASPSAVDGQFAGARYDAEADVVEVFNDPLGMQALYVAERSGRTFFSTSAAALAGYLGAEPDTLGVQVLLRSGVQIGPLTHWRGVERVEPSTALAFGVNGVQRREYWRPEVNERVRAMTLEQTADHCVEVMLSVVRKRFARTPPLWVDLTGGFDSRMVLAAVLRSGASFTANTNGEEGDPDVCIAREVADAAGCAWQHIRLAPDWADDASALLQGAAWADGTLNIFQLARVLRQHQMKAATSQYVVTGGGGEHFNSFPWQQEFLRAGRSRTVNYDALLKMRYLKQVSTFALQCDPDPAVTEYFSENLSNRAQRYANRPNTTQLDAIYAYKSVGHFGAFRSAGEGIVRTEVPCYYREIFDCAFSAHHRWRTSHRLQRRIITRLSPALAAVPTTHGGSAQPFTIRNARNVLPYYTSVAKRAARKLSRRGKPALPARRGTSLVERDRQYVQLLRSRDVFNPREMRSAELYDPARLRDFVARTDERGFTDWEMLGRIASVELALRAAGLAQDRSSTRLRSQPRLD